MVKLGGVDVVVGVVTKFWDQKKIGDKKVCEYKNIVSLQILVTRI